MKRKILIVVGTRPNFIKVTRFREVASAHKGLELKIVHTGQHSDSRMSDVFFRQLNLIPDFFLEGVSGTPVQQMAGIMNGLEILLNEYQPDLVMVVGDVNSTLAAALVANKKSIRLAHLESGLRSHDRSMPEEFNRILTDEMSNYFFVTEQSGVDNLLKEGVPLQDIFFVGNTMIDTLVAFDKQIRGSNILEELGVQRGRFVLMTMHRPATVDHREGLLQLLELVKRVSERYKVVFPIHPRSRAKIQAYGLQESFDEIEGLVFSEPLDYFSFQKLVLECRLVLTDSGGIQEESTFRQVPCFTLRPNTERPSTVLLGTNTLVPFDSGKIGELIIEVEKGTYREGTIPPLWDGKATQRIMEVLAGLIR